MARKIKTGVANVTNSPIKEVSLSKIKAQESPHNDNSQMRRVFRSSFHENNQG
jgi:hypothetical protein